MKKLDRYRFSIKLDETDADHRKVADYLNQFDRKKARIIVKAILLYMEVENGSIAVEDKITPQQDTAETEKIQEEPERMLTLDLDDYSMDQAEIELMRRNYGKLGSLE